MIALWLALAASAGPPVEFIAPDGGAPVRVTPAEREEITGLVAAAAESIRTRTGFAAGPVRIAVCADVAGYRALTRLPVHRGAVWQDGVIYLQPIGVLKRKHALAKLVRHELVHHVFVPLAPGWPPELHEAVAHRLSGGTARPSNRAPALATSRATARDDEEYYAHLAWLLERAIGRMPEPGFFRRLVAEGPAAVGLDRFTGSALR